MSRWSPQPAPDEPDGLIAKNRYVLFGRTDACMVPSPEDRERFLA